MMNDRHPDQIGQMLQTSRVIVMALAGGVLMFGLVTLVLRGGEIALWDADATVSLILAMVSLAMLPVLVFVPGIMVQAGTRQIASDRSVLPDVQPDRSSASAGDRDRLLPLFQSKTIIAGAILEGSALMNLVAFMLEGQAYSLGLAILFLAGLVAKIPTRRALEDWLERQSRHVTEIRELEGRSSRSPR